MSATVKAIDLFCGYGGSSQGIHRAGGEVRIAANHNAHALEIHGANFPDTDHVRADLIDQDSADYVDPADLPPAQFLWASPSCRFHSQANSKKLYAQGPSLFDDGDFDQDLYANSERSRVTMVCPLRYAAKHKPEAVVVENVVEAAKWGPDRDGSTFHWWLREWELLGYRHEILFLNSQFFPPCPQSRDRMYVVMWKEGNRKPDLAHRPQAYCISNRCGGRLVEAIQVWKRRTATWPLERWGKWGQQYDYRCPDCAQEVTPVAWPAASAIDWSNLGSLISERGKALAPNTIERIRRGLAKFAQFPVVLTDQQAITSITEVTHEGDRNPRHPGGPIGSSTAKNGVGVASLIVAAGNTFERPGSFTRVRHPAEVVWTQHATGFVGLAHLRGNGDNLGTSSHPGEPVHTLAASGRHHAVISGGWIKQNAGQTTAWHPYSDPFGTATSIDTTGLVMVPWIDQWCSDPGSVLEPVAAALTHLRHSLAVAPEGDPGSIPLEDVRFRMLEPDPELRRVMAFDDDFKLFGNKTQTTAGLGNAVTPPVADWICKRVIGSLDS